MNQFRHLKWLLLLCTSCLLYAAHAQQPSTPVTGSVKNERGEPLPAVSVKIAGTERGTVTDQQGKFSITVPENTRLLISYVGYDSLLVTARTSLELVLKPAANALNDVVVIGYGTTRRKELTGSVATVNAKDFQQGVITTPEQLIAGKVAGVSVTSNGGAPGAGSVIRIRGGASLNASNDPLIVVDGVPLSGNNIYGASNSLSLINPNDIATFTVLKDAAATAIYGSRASNGVILITTKKGVSGQPQFSFSTQVSVSTIAKKMDVQSAGDFRKYVDSLGGGTYDNIHSYKSLLGNASTDWQDEIFQTAIGTDNNLSIAGAVKNTPYRVSLGYLDQQGILRTDHLQRMSGGISLSPRLFDNHLKVDINLKGAYNKTRFANNAAISSAVYFDPTQPVHATSPYGNYFEWASVDPSSGAVTLNKLAPRNPVALLDLYNNSSNVYRSYGNVQFDYKFHWLPELHANLNLGYDIAKGDGKIDVPAFAAQNFLDGGQRNKYSNRINNKVGEFYLNYTKDLKDIKSNINVTAGYGYYNNLSTNDFYAAFRANGDTIPGSKPVFPTDKPENTLISYYGRLIYTFNSKYIFAASIRTDGSSRFAPDVRWGTFPSAAFTWQMNRESFLQDVKSLSNLSLRLSYGVTGNQDGIYNYPYQSIYSLSGNGSAVQFGNSWYYMGTPAAYDAGIKWEQTATYNAGLDYGFFNNRINGSVDVYFKKTKDLLNTIPIPAGSNFSSTILTNVGNVENKGVELAINAAVIKGSKFNWDVSFNAAYNENKITNLTATKDSTYPGTLTGNGVIQINSVGYQANSFYVYHQQYLNGKPVEGVYVDINKDGVINQKDLYRYKSPFPKFTLGFSTQFTYGRWALNTVLRANIGNYVYNGIATGSIRANLLNPLGYLANGMNDVYNTGFINGQNQSDYYIENASFLKMDNLGLAYNVGRLLHDKVGLRLTANCQNVFTVTKYKGLDPEIYGGIDNTIYPRPRIVTIGASLQF
ncbi:SusC/RagA family TonB-linked outer membrane protein [Paraflavitalea pollutisoli]|uniref:SusC/RagA family TonB-linked outer membrane protein n=1 Tax=Paraflavitalea pollutisoli TaxID=3034143 RepID=UPI0023ED4CF0|nr:SusC/RagA family TonB-linked outer membrane protein [Paraflavitalea sp. H1-2-19X]